MAKVEAQHAIVRADENLSSGHGHDRVPVRAHARIHDDDVDGARGEMGHGPGYEQGRLHQVLRSDGMGAIDDFDIGAARKEDALHGGGIGVPRAEIGRQCHQGPMRLPFPHALNPFRGLSL